MNFTTHPPSAHLYYPLRGAGFELDNDAVCAAGRSPDMCGERHGTRLLGWDCSDKSEAALIVVKLHAALHGAEARISPEHRTYEHGDQGPFWLVSFCTACHELLTGHQSTSGGADGSYHTDCWRRKERAELKATREGSSS